MSDPITPKAEHHVVEGEFVEAESKSANSSDHETDPSKKAKRVKTSHNNSWRSNLLIWLILLVSGTAFALALASWLFIQQSPTRTDLVSQIQSQQAELIQLTEQLKNQQQHLAEFGQTQQAWKQALAELEASQQSSQIQLEEMQLRLTEASQAMFGFSESDDKVIKINDPKLREDFEQAKQDLQTGLQTLREELAELNQRSQQELSEIEGYVESEQWQQDKQRLQTEIQSLSDELANLAQTQADWMASMAPKVQEAVDEITPQLEGLFSRFNQLFSIKKHPTDETSEPSVPVEPTEEGAQ